jgi:L-aspartate oxidase
VLVHRGGVAGLRAAAIAAAQEGVDVLILTKDTVDQSNTWYAQGGIAAVLQPLDSYDSHVQDTEKGGAGLCDHAAVGMVVREGPQRVLELLSWGANFDKDATKPHGLSFTLEGGHSFARIVHAYGDSTGRELAQTLINTVWSKESIRVSERTFCIDLLTHDGQCLGCLALIDGDVNVIWARRTILASGGAGQLFRESTNPKIATADGHAMAYRAGATLQDMEMVQFHPTTLYIAGASRALITEAVRGEGAYLVDKNGHRFMPEYHENGELAPRDVVSRAIVQQIRKTHFTARLPRRPPPADRPVPRAVPAARPADGRVRDRHGEGPHPHPPRGPLHDRRRRRRPRRPHEPAGLYAVGEASCSGLHGANRLGSNSLLEGLAFGARAARRRRAKDGRTRRSSRSRSTTRSRRRRARSWTSPT